MTRETKIGLLVGLAFIIVIGILLSDHLTSSTEPPPATLANAGNTVRQTVTTPGSNTTQPPITNVSTAPQPVTPQQLVPTPSELQQPQRQPVQIVQVGGPSGPMQQGVQPSQVQQQQLENGAVALAPQPVDESTPIITQVPGNLPGSLAQAAQQRGEGLVTLDSSGRPVQTSSNPPGWTGA